MRARKMLRGAAQVKETGKQDAPPRHGRSGAQSEASCQYAKVPPDEPTLIL
jgi:hypothetical protein